MPSNRADFYDHNGGTFNSVPILEGEIRHLPDLCLHAFSQQPLRAWAHTMGRSKGHFETNLMQLRSWKFGSGEAELFKLQSGGIELAGGSKGELVWVYGDSRLMPLEMMYEGSSHCQRLS